MAREEEGRILYPGSSSTNIYSLIPKPGDLVPRIHRRRAKRHRLVCVSIHSLTHRTFSSLILSRFCVLDIGNKSIESIPERFRVLDGLFQAFAIRSGGFYVFAIPDLRPGLLVLYVLMMYISVYPVTMAMRNTNTYEERSLGVYADQIEQGIDVTSSTGRAGGRSNFLQIFGHGFSGGSSSYFIRQQLHGQLAHDLWWLALAVLFITIVETGQFERDPTVFSIFNIMFEVVSGYGCVGVSTGVPWAAYSFCGSWHVTSKLILCAVMLRGRHRGLPVAIDKAILLPDKTLAWAEEEDAQLRLERSLSRQRTGLKES